jgi:hypothetical protein
MKKTPMQKHVDFLNGIVEGIVDRNIKTAFEIIRNRATKLLEEEKQMVIDSWIDGEGRFFDAGTEIIEAEKYFNETFEQ